MKTRRFALWMGVVAAAAMALRVVSILTLAKRNPDGGDPFYYHVQANLIAKGHGFAEPFTWVASRRLLPSAVHPPLYSLVLSGASVFGGTGFFAHKVMSCAVGTATVVVVGLVGREVAGPRAGIIAAVIAAAYPNLWVIDGILQPEGLFALTIALTVLAAYRFLKRPTLRTAVVTGAAIALSSLARGEGLFLLGLLAVPMALRLKGPSLRRRLTLLAAMGVAAVAVIAPWTVRNLRSFHDPVLLSTNSYEVLAQANCDSTYGGGFFGFWDFGCGQPPDPKLDESERATLARQKGTRYIRHHMGRFPAVVAARVGRIWDAYRPWQNALFSQIEGRRHSVARWGLRSYWALLVPALAGGLVLWRRKVPLLPLLAQAALVTVTAVYAYGVVRFRVPAEVPLVVLAGVGLDAGVGRLRPARARS